MEPLIIAEIKCRSTSEQKTQTSEVLTTDSETQTTGQAEVAVSMELCYEIKI